MWVNWKKENNCLLYWEAWPCGFQQDTSDTEEEDDKSNSTDSEDEDEESSASTDSEDEDDEVRIQSYTLSVA